jgi:hypothetical protein
MFELAPLLAAQANLTGPPTQDQLIHLLLALSGRSVCQIHQQYCTGENQQVASPSVCIDKQYSSFDACMQFMMSIPFGKPYELGQNTSSCRNIHQNMIPLRPTVHCMHIGPYSHLSKTILITDLVEANVFQDLMLPSPTKITFSIPSQILLHCIDLLNRSQGIFGIGVFVS